MGDPVRVLHVFAALDSGGVSNFVMNLYREMDTDKIQFDFALTAGYKALYDDEVVSRGGRIFYFDTSRSIPSNLYAILRREGPFHAVHSHLFFYSGLVLAEARLAGVPVRIAHAHNAHTGESRSVLRLFYERGMQYLTCLNATHLLGCSEKACLYVFGRGIIQDSRTRVVPDGIDCKRFAFDPLVRENVRAEYGLTGKYVIGHVGHFTPAKNHEKIISVFKTILDRRPDAALLLVGDGELEMEVRERVLQEGLDGHVIFAGAHKDVERFYQAMDVFFFPSRYEGFGMAMIEAQAGGLSCVASDIVPKDTNADGRCVYLALDAEDSLWADRILEAPVRDSFAFEQICAKYGAANTAQQVAAIYN